MGGWLVFDPVWRSLYSFQAQNHIHNPRIVVIQGQKSSTLKVEHDVEMVGHAESEHKNMSYEFQGSD